MIRERANFKPTISITGFFKMAHTQIKSQGLSDWIKK